MNRIKVWLIKKLGGIPPLPKDTVYKGYFNGYCPECKTHIGTFIIETKGGKELIECGHCSFIFPKPEGLENA